MQMFCFFCLVILFPSGIDACSITRVQTNHFHAISQTVLLVSHFYSHLHIDKQYYHFTNSDLMCNTFQPTCHVNLLSVLKDDLKASLVPNSIEFSYQAFEKFYQFSPFFFAFSSLFLKLTYYLHGCKIFNLLC